MRSYWNNLFNRAYNEFVRLLPSVITIGGILVGLYQFNKEQKSLHTLEFRRNYWEKQLNIYEETSKISSSIINALDDTSGNSLDSAFAEYKDLYWGKLKLVQDSLVAVSANLLLFQIEDFGNSDKFLFHENPEEKITIRCSELIGACKVSLTQEWQELSK